MLLASRENGNYVKINHMPVEFAKAFTLRRKS